MTEILSTAGLVVSLAAVALALLSAVRARRAEAEVRRITRTVEHALRRLSERDDQTAASVEALTAKVNRELAGISERVARTAATKPAPSEPAFNDNVIPLSPSARRPKPRQASDSPLEIGGYDAFDLSLQPIVDIGSNAAVAFDVFANLRLADGAERPARRLGSEISAADRTTFEMALFQAAVGAARRQVAGAAPGLPLHVALSAATLDAERSIATIMDMIDSHPGVARGLVYSLPASLFTGREFHPAAERIARAGGRLALEGWPDAVTAGDLARCGIECVAMPAQRLLDADSDIRSGADIPSTLRPAGLSLIATGIASDEEAVALLDLGVTLMSGERFSGPRRLRPTDPPSDAMVNGG